MQSKHMWQRSAFWLAALLTILLLAAPAPAAQAAPSTITIIAGTGVAGSSGDNGPATSALLRSPSGITVDGAGNIFIADTSNHLVRKVDTDGIITTIAGTGIGGFGGYTDGNGVATNVQLKTPYGLVVDSQGNLFIADNGNHLIRKMDADGNISVFAGLLTDVGNGEHGYSGDGNPATAFKLWHPSGILMDSAGSLFIADLYNNRVRKVDADTSAISTVAGTGSTSVLSNPVDVALDSSGNLFIADRNNNRIRKLDTNGNLSDVATDSLSTPFGVEVDGSGNLFIADTGNSRILKMDTNGATTVIANSTQVNAPRDLHLDGQGNLLVADYGNHRILKIEGVAASSSPGLPSATVNVPGTSDPWLAGMPTGSTASVYNGIFSVAPTHSPVLVPFVVTGGNNYTFSATGLVDHGYAPWASGPDGYSSFWNHQAGAENRIGDINVHINALLGVFLDDSPPNTTSAPSALNFSSAGAMDFLTLSPQLKQPFFIGDGLTSTGDIQRFVAPAGATRLFLGTMDSFGYYNNTGSFTVQIATTHTNTPPVADAGGPYSVDEGSAIALDGSSSTDDSAVTQYEWDCTSDGTYDVTSANATGDACTYDDDGNFTVTLRVSDAAGLTDTDTAAVTVSNVAPTATFGNDGPVDEGADFTLALTNPTDPGADTFTYAFDCGDGNGYASASASSSASCSTTTPGVRSVKGKIIDDDGGESEYTGSVTVNDVPPFLDIPDDLIGNQGGTVDVPLNLTKNGDQISALNFTIGFDAACLSLDTTDGNSDGVPDAVVLNQTTGFQISANSSNAAAGSLELVLNAQANNQSLPTFNDGAVATVIFSIVCGNASTDLTISNASFGNNQGASVTGQTEGGAVDINRPPVAVDDVSKTTPSQAVTIDVLANDTDPDADDSHTVANVTNPSNGTASIQNNEVVYTPNANFLGLDSFEYTISDGNLTDTGLVRVAVGIRGDANADVTVDAGDLPAVVLEIFDGDGSGWLDTLGGTFLGNPVGTDSNEDESITAGDLSCTVRLLLFGVNDPCAAVQRSAAKASLSLPSNLSVQDGLAQVPVHFTANGNQAAALALALKLDAAQVGFDATDSNGDGLPDGLQINLAADFQAVAIYKDSILNLVIFSPQLHALPDGAVATLSLSVVSASGDGPALRFSQSQPVSVGGVDGATVPVQIDNDAVDGVNQPLLQRHIFLPTVGR